MSYKIISKFIKDISFEIPNVQAFVMIEKEILNYSLNFDIKSDPYKNNIIEVSTILKIVPNEKVKHKILAEINCSSLVSIEKDFNNKKELEKIVLIKPISSKFKKKENNENIIEGIIEEENEEK